MLCFFSYLEGLLLISDVFGFSAFFIVEHIQKSGNHRKLQSVSFERGEDVSCYYKKFLIILSFYETDLKVLLQVISANRELNLEAVLLICDVK